MIQNIPVVPVSGALWFEHDSVRSRYGFRTATHPDAGKGQAVGVLDFLGVQPFIIFAADLQIFVVFRLPPIFTYRMP